MDYKVESAMRTGSFSGQYGETYKYAIKLEGLGEAVELNQKPETPAPKAGDTLSGTIEDTKSGKRFKKAFAGGGFGKNDPATREEIIRQNALTNAVNFCINKANLLKDKDYLTGKQVVQVATYFARYSQGKVVVDMTPEEVARIFGYDEPKEAPKEEAAPPPQEESREEAQDPTEGINLEDVPF